MIKIVVGVTAVAVPIRTVWPAMQPSPKKSVGPNIATTASFPDPFTTDNFTPPCWTYMTLLAASPWLKMDSFLRNCVIFLEIPAVSRNTCGVESVGLPVLLVVLFFIIQDATRSPHTCLLAMSTVTKSTLTKLCRIGQSLFFAGLQRLCSIQHRQQNTHRAKCMCR